MKHQPLTNHETYIWALQLSIMQASGVPLLAGLKSLAQSELPRLGSVCTLLAQKVAQGHSLSEAMRSLDPTFSPFAVNLVVVGESSGKMGGVLERISLRASRRDRMERAVKGALAYPVFLATVSVAMAAFMALYMFPRLLPFLVGLGAALPWPTRVLVWLTDNLASLVLVVTVLAAWFGGLLAFNGDPRIRRVREWVLYRTPVVGPLSHDRIYADALGDLYLLLEAQVDLVTSLKTLHPPWPEYRERVQQCIAAMQAGAEFSEAAKTSGMLPPRFSLQVKSGVETGKLPGVFKRISEFLDEMIQLRVAQLVQLLEPLIMVVMGLVTGFVVLATFLPLYSMAATTL